MIRRLCLLVLAVVATACGDGPRVNGSATVSTTASSTEQVLAPTLLSQCHQGNPLAGVAYWAQVQVMQGCRTLSGIVDCMVRRPDAEVVLYLRAGDQDDRTRIMLTQANALQHCPTHAEAHLVVVSLPQHCSDLATASCAEGFFTTPKLPRVGQRVAVSGPVVLDAQHATEILPAERIDIQ